MVPKFAFTPAAMANSDLTIADVNKEEYGEGLERAEDANKSR
jgi:hypothetical protein